MSAEKFENQFPRESVIGDSHMARHNDLEIDVYKLIHLTKEVSDVDVQVEDFSADLNDKSWTDARGKPISPQEVMDVCRGSNATTEHPELITHIKKIQGADLSFPVIVFESKIIDGMHRFVRALLEGKVSVRAKILDEIPGNAVIKAHKKE